MSRLTQYRVFAAIVETGSVTNAAKQLLSTPSSVSKQLSKLEQSLEVRLIERSTHAMTATKEGLEFYNKVKDILDRIDEAEESLKADKLTLKGNIHLSLPSILLKLPILDLIETFNTQHPDIRFKITVSDDFTDLIQNQVDFALRIGRLSDSNLTAAHLGKLKIALFAAPKYIERHGKIPFSHLTKDKHLIIPGELSASGMNRLMTVTEGENVSDLSLFHSTQHSLTLIEMAKAGLGIAPCLTVATRQEVKQGNLVELYKNKRSPMVDITLLYYRQNTNDSLPAYKQAFKDYFKTQFPKLIRS